MIERREEAHLEARRARTTGGNGRRRSNGGSTLVCVSLDAADASLALVPSPSSPRPPSTAPFLLFYSSAASLSPSHLNLDPSSCFNFTASAFPSLWIPSSAPAAGVPEIEEDGRWEREREREKRRGGEGGRAREKEEQRERELSLK